jgi:chromosome partitioning protein
MKTLAVVCEKGGTGKSTLSGELYRALDRRGFRASLYSLDGQYNPTRSKKTEDAEVAVVDTPGVIADNLKDIIEGADLLVVPTRPTPNDIEPFTRTVEIIRSLTDAPVLIAVNGFNRYKMAASFKDWLEGKDWADHIVLIPQAEAFPQAEAMDNSVMDIDSKSKAAQAVERLCNEAINLAGIDIEHIEE